MKHTILIVAFFYSIIIAAQPQELDYPKSDVDYPTFTELTSEAEEHRKTHMASLEDFIKWFKEKDVIVLDTRSKKMFDMKHVKGAVHLNFSDVTATKLAEVIPSKDTKVLIYCNNNLDKDETYFARKMAPLALNIPTFINLYGYGYKNGYELDRLLPTSVVSMDGVVRNVTYPLPLEGKAIKN